MRRAMLQLQACMRAGPIVRVRVNIFGGVGSQTREILFSKRKFSPNSLKYASSQAISWHTWHVELKKNNA